MRGDSRRARCAGLILDAEAASLVRHRTLVYQESATHDTSRDTVDAWFYMYAAPMKSQVTLIIGSQMWRISFRQECTGDKLIEV